MQCSDGDSDCFRVCTRCSTVRHCPEALNHWFRSGCNGALISPPTKVQWCARGRGFSCTRPISDRPFCMANFKNRLAHTKKWLPLCPLLAAPSAQPATTARVGRWRGLVASFSVFTEPASQPKPCQLPDDAAAASGVQRTSECTARLCDSGGFSGLQ